MSDKRDNAVAELNALPGTIEPIATKAKAEAAAVNEAKPFDPMVTPIWEIDPDFINPYKVIPPLQTWAKIGGRPALPKEGIITFSAKQKQGKSLSSYAFVMPLLTGKPFSSVEPVDRPRLIMVFDMEMSETTLVNRTLRQVQAIGQNGVRFAVCFLKTKSVEERREIIKAKTEQYNPDIVIVDQAAKLVHDINSTTESSEVTDMLDALSHGRSVWVVIHENKSATDGNMRGHLGTALSHANVEAYTVTRKNGVFTVTFKEGRDTDADNAVPVEFTLDADSRIIDARAIVEATREKERDEWSNNFRRIFGEDEVLSYSDLYKRLMSQEKLEERAAKRALENAKKSGAIVKAGDERNAPYKLA